MLSTLRGKEKTVEAPPLTVEQVLKYVQGVKNWREVGKRLLGYGNRTKLDAIERKYTVDEDRLQAVVQQWLEGGVLTPSWRSLVWSLDRAGDITVADPIRGFAEPPPDPTLTVEKIGPIMEMVGDWRKLANDYHVFIPYAIQERITCLHTTDKEQSCAAGEWWVCTDLFPSWNNFAYALYRNREDRALEKMAQYLPRADPTLTTENLMEVVNGVEDRWEKLGDALCFPHSVRESEKHKIERLYRSDHQRMEALINHYVRHYPFPSWKGVASALERMELRRLAKVVTTKYVRGPKEEEKRHLAACERAMKEKGSLDQTAMHCVFMGIPRSGKSSLIRRLLGKRLFVSASTGVADKVVRVEIRKSTVHVSGLCWCELEDIDDEALALMHDVSKTTSVHFEGKVFSVSELLRKIFTWTPKTKHHKAATSSPSTHKQPTSSTPDTQSSAKTQLADEEDVKPPLEVFRDAFQKKRSKLKELIDEPWTLYITDTGGQPEFQELLPILVSGPSLFFLTFRLDMELNRRYQVEYIDSKGKSIIPYESGLTVQEMLLQSLATIASTSIFRIVGSERVAINPNAFLVGTHRDLVSDEHLQQVDSVLQVIVRGTEAFREGMIQFASESRLILAVNNLSEGEEDVQQIRAAVERMGRQGDNYRVRTPFSWLAFSNIMQQMRSPILRYERCYSVAQQCGIKTRNEMNDALRFLHENVGVIRYYHDVSELHEFVIKDPQYVFDMITDLIVATFTFDRTAPALREQFKKKGIFPLDVFEKLARSTEFLPPSKLVALLQHLNIVALLKKDGVSSQYFIPCVLAHSESSSAGTSAACSSAPSLLVTFESGYCPKGLFGALVVYLLQNKMKSELEWGLEQDKIFRDQICFSVGPFDSFQLKVLPAFLSIELCASSGASTRRLSLASVCSEVQRCISSGIDEVSKTLHCSQKAAHSFGFFCPEVVDTNSSPHPATVNFHRGEPCNMKCPLTHERFDLPGDYQVWFSEGESTPDSSTATCARSYSRHFTGGSRPTQKQLLQQLYNSVPDKWRAIGTYLEIPEAQLSTIDEWHRGDPQKCLMAMLTEGWLPRVNPPPMWQEIAEAVEFVGHPDVAQKLRQKFCPQ